MNKKRFFSITIILLLIILIALLVFDFQPKPSYHADISEIEIEPIEIKRFEKVLFELNPFSLRQEIEPYIDEFYFFMGDEIDNPLAQQQLYDYVTDPLIIDLYNDVLKVFTNLEELEKELTKAFRYYKFHFPDKEIPKIYTYVSGLDLSNPVKYSENNEIAVALDMYLGHDFIKYSQIGIPAYQLMRRSPDFIVRDIMKVIAESKITEDLRTENMLDFMIYEGIKLYFIDCMMPYNHDTVKIGYTSMQNYWMEHHQGQVWSYLLDNQLFFSTNRNRINPFIIDAPFTTPFTNNSSPRVGIWLGWQIVREYMKRNHDITLNELVIKTDAEEILNSSRFKP